MLKKLTFTFAGLSLLIFLFFIWMGIFHEISIKEEDRGPFMLVYQTQTGPYSQTMGTIEEVKDKVRALGLYPGDGAAIYYSDPAEVPEEELKSEAGCLLNREDLDQVDKIKGELQVREIPRQTYVVSEFPYRNTISIVIGILKVYPALNTYFDEKGYEEGFGMEFYQTKQIEYLMQFEQ